MRRGRRARPHCVLRVALALVVVAGATGCSLLDADDVPTTSLPSASERLSWSRAAVAVILDAAAPSADTAASADVEGEPARTLLANARALRVRDLDLVLDAEVPGSLETPEPGAATSTLGWTLSGTLRWRFAGYDQTVSRAPVLVRFSSTSGSAVATLAGFSSEGPQADSAPRPRVPTWVAGRPVRVVRADGVLVVTAGPSPARYLRLVRTARRLVTDLLGADRASAGGGGADPPRIVVGVPPDAAALGAALGARPGEYDAIAALTATVDGSTRRTAPQHVYVNPEVFDTLHGTGARVVLTHEVTHEVTGAATASAPTWLVEGFADYVALRHVALPVDVTAARIIARVRAEGLPDALPDDEAFASTARGLDATYEGAWLVCRVLAARRGDRGLVALYRQVSEGRPLASALRADYGLSTTDLVGLWRQRLQHLAK